jgi:hypothetical protein
VRTFGDSITDTFMAKAIKYMECHTAQRRARLLALPIIVEPERLSLCIPKHAAPTRGVSDSGVTSPRTRHTPVRGFALCGGLHDQLQHFAPLRPGLSYITGLATILRGIVDCPTHGNP